MYNMSVNVFGYKMSIISLLFFAIVIILISHTYSGCCNNPYALIEGYEGGASEEHKDKKDVKHKKGTKDKKGAKDKEPKSDKEGFTGANTNYGQSSMYDIGLDVPVNTSNWSQPNMVVRPGQPLDPAVQKFLSRPHQPLPLPSGEMDMFFNTPFSPECCPNTYSNSSGCACMTGNQYNYLITRGGNNVPYSEY
jgi:hypothetical protein